MWASRVPLMNYFGVCRGTCSSMRLASREPPVVAAILGQNGSAQLKMCREYQKNGAVGKRRGAQHTVETAASADSEPKPAPEPQSEAHPKDLHSSMTPTQDLKTTSRDEAETTDGNERRGLRPGGLPVADLHLPKSVASSATDSNVHFYVESDSLADLLSIVGAKKKTVMYVAPHQSGKTTDLLALRRELITKGCKVAYIDLARLARAAADQPFDCQEIWAAILDQVDIPPVGGASPMDILQSFLKQKGPDMVLLFDEGDAMIHVPDGLKEWLRGVYTLSKLSKSRLRGVMLVGTRHLHHAVATQQAALDDEKWSRSLMRNVSGPAAFTLSQVADLVEQLVTSRGVRLADPVVQWAKQIWSRTEGNRGLTGLCLEELDSGLFRAQPQQHTFTLPDCALHLKQWAAERLASRIPFAHGRMMAALTSGAPVVDDMVRLGEHQISPSTMAAAEELCRDGVVNIVKKPKGKSYVRMSSPLLATAMVRAHLEAKVPSHPFGQFGGGAFAQQGTQPIPPFLRQELSTLRSELLKRMGGRGPD